MTMMSSVNRTFEATDDELAERLQFVFVSLDPARDTLEHLGSYVKFFSAEFIAATGPEAALPALTGQFGVLRSLQPPDEDGNYFVDHTTA